VILPWHPGQGRSTRLHHAPADFEKAAGEIATSPMLGEVGAVLMGYLGGEAQVAPLAALVRAVKARNPRAVFLCDPVIGDSYGLFQPASVAASIRDTLLPLADIANSNRYELAWLTGREAPDNDALVAAARSLGIGEVVVTSAFAPPGEIGTLVVTADTVHLESHRLVPAAPHGTGDLFAALYLAHRLDGATPAVAVERATHAVLALIEMAVAGGANELPLAEGQAAFFTGS
jgi:pyridoxine kinase